MACLNKTMQINVDDKLGQDLEKIVSQSPEFNSVDEYAAYVLKQIADKKLAVEKTDQQDEVYSKEDEEKIKERLQNLGYLD